MARASQLDPVHASPEAPVSSPRPAGSPGRVPVSSSCRRRYGVAVLATAAALLFRLALHAVLEDRGVFLPSTLALLVSAWYGGLGPGLLATGLSASVIPVVLLEPRWSPRVALLADGLSLAIFVVVGLGISVLVAQLHRARRRAEAEVAERRAAEESRRAHERFIQQITALSPVVLDVFDLVTERHTYFSDGSVTLFGYTPEELTQMHHKFAVLVHPDDLPCLADDLARLRRLADGEIHEFECRVRRRDGEWRWVAARSMVFARTEQGEVRQTVNAAFDVTERKHAEDALRRAHDELEQRVMERTSQLTAINAELIREITERRRAEETLRRSEAYLAEGQRLTHTASGSWNVVTGEVFWSQETYRIYGVDPGQTQPSYDVFFGIVHPEERLFLEQAFARVVRDSSDYDLEFRIIRPDGSVRHIHSVGHPVFDEAGHMTEVIGTVVDVTERKRAEEALQKAQAELAHMTRVMTLGELVAAIAHEVNQPLGAIVTNAQACLRLLARASLDLDKVRDVVERVISDGLRASDVITRIRALVKKHDAEKALLHVNEIIQDVIALTSSTLSTSAIHLQTALAADLPPVWGDRVQLQQVILNLILNAKEAMDEAGWQSRALSITSRASPSGEIEVAVRDSGTGLDLRDGERIFDAFFTTKAEGLGLGLSISRTIIEAHGGRLWATANDGPGATVGFTLPTGRAQA